MQDLQTTRDGFGLGLLQAAEQNEQVVGVCADLTESTRMQWFHDQFPDRFFQAGVAEQDLIGIAAGLALGGCKPFAASYACFSPANSWGVIRTSVCYNDVPVTIVGGHAGFVTGEDGATHQSLEDIATMRVLPNMTVIVPADGEEARKATLALASHPGPAYLRTSKHIVPLVTTSDTPFVIGKSVTLAHGNDLTLIACGSVVAEAVQAALLLRDNSISARVINMHTIKPIDQAAIMAAAKETRAILTIEDHQVIGGLGSAVAEVLAENGMAIPFRRLGAVDTFGESGKAQELLKRHGLDFESIAQTAVQLHRDGK